MRHQRRTRKLGWKTAHRISNLRNMVTSLFQHGRIITTVPRAKELRRLADKMITLAKDGSLHAKRQAFAVIRDRDVVAKLFTHWKDVMANRNGGYTRLIRLGQRVGDAAPLTIIELVQESYNKKTDKKLDLKDITSERDIVQAKEKPEKVEEELEVHTPVTETDRDEKTELEASETPKETDSTKDETNIEKTPVAEAKEETTKDTPEEGKS